MQLEVIPAIIPESEQDMTEKLARVEGLVPVVQVDVVDGHFAPQQSWPFKEGQQEAFQEIVKQDRSLPFSEAFFFEADLMVAEPEKYIDDFVFAGFERVIVHIESTNKISEIIHRLRELDVEIGIAISIDTPLDILEPHMDRIDIVQCMGIAEIGAQGQPFDMRAVEKIAALKAQYPDILISVDGGVSLQTAPFLIGAGAERLVSGSTIFESEDIEKTLGQFFQLPDQLAEHYEQ